MKIAFIGDAHQGKLINNNKSMQRLGYNKFMEAADVCIKDGVKILVLVGDVFDTVKPPPDAFHEVFMVLKKLTDAGIKVYIISGNHDKISAYFEISPVLNLNKIDNVFYQNKIQPWRVTIKNKKINLVFVNFDGNTERFRDHLKACSQLKKDDHTNILMSHIPIREEIWGNPEENISYDDLPTESFNYIFLGDIHDSIVQKRKNCEIFFTGSINHTKIPEWVEKDLTFLIYDSDTDDVEVKTLEKPPVVYVREPKDVNKVTENCIAVDKIGKKVIILKRNPLYCYTESEKRIEDDTFDFGPNENVSQFDINTFIDTTVAENFDKDTVILLKYVLNDIDSEMKKDALVEEMLTKVSEIIDNINKTEEEEIEID